MSYTLQTYAEAKHKLRSNALEHAVQWAKGLKLVNAELTVLGFELEYLERILNAVAMSIPETETDERPNFDAIMKFMGEKDTWVGKSQEVDGKPVQPVIDFSNQEYQDEDGNKITDLEWIGKSRADQILHRHKTKKQKQIMLEEQRKLLAWKQKFYRYMYNHDTSQMDKYHNKISAFESTQLDERIEADASGQTVFVEQHNPDAKMISELDGLDLGYAAQKKAEDNTTESNGGNIKDFADRIKEAYEVRVKYIGIINMLKETKELGQTKTAKFRMWTQVDEVDGSVPALM